MYGSLISSYLACWVYVTIDLVRLLYVLESCHQILYPAVSYHNFKYQVLSRGCFLFLLPTPPLPLPPASNSIVFTPPPLVPLLLLDALDLWTITTTYTNWFCFLIDYDIMFSILTGLYQNVFCLSWSKITPLRFYTVVWLLRTDGGPPRVLFYKRFFFIIFFLKFIFKLKPFFFQICIENSLGVHPLSSSIFC